MGKIYSNKDQTLRLLMAGVSPDYASGYIVIRLDGSEDEAQIAPNGHFSECGPLEIYGQDATAFIYAFSCFDLDYFYLHKTKARESLYYAFLDQAIQGDPSGEFDLLEIMTQVLEKFPEKIKKKR